ncbi:MAG: sugar ABC transporter permease [Treponemataceae bacterium]|nr:sugar ABC transporter permease [Treponemataceae bacterium]
MNTEVPPIPSISHTPLSRKKAIGVALASACIPGLGQLINKQKLKALFWFLLAILFFTIEVSTSQWGRYLRLIQGKVSKEEMFVAEQTARGEANGSTTLEQAETLGDILGLEEGSASSPDELFNSSEENLFGSDTDTPPLNDNLFGGPESSAEEDNSQIQNGADIFTGTSDEEVLKSSAYRYPNYQQAPVRYPLRDFGGFFTRGLWGLATLGHLVIGDSYAGGTIELYNKDIPWLTADNSIVLLGNGLLASAVLLVFGILWLLGIFDAYRTNIRFQATGLRESSLQFWKRIWDSLYVYLVSAPAFLMILLFTIIPIFFTFLLAFTNYTYRIKLGAKLIQWVGLDTFAFLAMDPGWLRIFGQIFLWTLLWAIMSSFTVYGVGFFNAMVVESPLVKHKRLWRTIMILPWAIPSLVSLMMFRNAFDKDGLVNQFLFATGLMEPVTNFLYHIGLEGKPDQPIFWFQPIYNGNLARFVVILVNLWLGAPYHMMMIIGTLSTIPRELYEAAAIDGASSWQRFKYITWPMVISATMPALIMTFSFNFNNFGAVYFLTGGGPNWDPAQIPDSMRIVGSAMPGQTDILISWIYKLSFTKDFEQYNVAAIYTLLIFLIVGSVSVYNLVKSRSFQEEAGE